MTVRLHIRRRALLAFRALGAHESYILQDVIRKMRQRLQDPDPTVASAALTVSLRLLEVGLPRCARTDDKNNVPCRQASCQQTHFAQSC